MKFYTTNVFPNRDPEIIKRYSYREIWRNIFKNCCGTDVDLKF